MQYVIILISACMLACGVRKTDLNKVNVDLSKQLKEQTSSQQTAQSQTSSQNAETNNDILELETIDSAIAFFRPDGTLTARKSIRKRRIIIDKSKTMAKKQSQKNKVDQLKNQTKIKARKTLLTDSVKKTIHKKTEADKTISTNLKAWGAIMIVLITGLIIYFKKR